jgi:hypothetical protein
MPASACGLVVALFGRGEHSVEAGDAPERGADAGQVEHAQPAEAEPEGGNLAWLGAVQPRDVHDVTQAPPQPGSVLQESVQLPPAALQPTGGDRGPEDVDSQTPIAQSHCAFGKLDLDVSAALQPGHDQHDWPGRRPGRVTGKDSLEVRPLVLVGIDTSSTGMSGLLCKSSGAAAPRLC